MFTLDQHFYRSITNALYLKKKKKRSYEIKKTYHLG